MTKSGNLGWSQNETRHDTLVEFVLCQFCGHLGWFKSLKWCQGKGFETQWGGGRSIEWELREGLESEDAGSLVLNGIMSGDESAQRATHGAI